MIPAKKNILYLDDDYQAGLLVKVFLERENFEINVCLNTQEAREKLNEKKIDFVISDIGLPGEDGIQFYDWMMESDYKNIPFLFVSAHAVGYSDALTKHKDIFFEKPIYFPKLINYIKEVFKNTT